jgi:hypothetical protein
MKEGFYNDLLFTHKIALICDYFWPVTGDRYEKQFKHLNKGLSDFSLVKPYSIIYADSSLLGCFNNFNSISVPFILVSAESDYSIPFIDTKNKYLGNFVLLENKNLIRWYSTNVDLIHPKLSCIPIGLPKHVPFMHQSYMGWNTSSRINDVDNFINNFIYIPSLKENVLNRNNNDYRELLYFKMTIGNSKQCNHIHENIREESLVKLNQNGFTDIDTKLIYWTDYIIELSKYKFCLSLPGKGLDCYRTWESLTLGVIPIVINSNLNTLYDDLPVLIINDVSEITSEFLNDKYNEICINIDKYNWDKLSSSYWIEKIKNTT